MTINGESLRHPFFVCFLILTGVAPAIKAVLTARRIMDRTDFFDEAASKALNLNEKILERYIDVA